MGSITEIDNVVRGSGKTVSEAQNQFVQSQNPVIKSGMFRGRFYNEGQLLFDIDPIDAKTQLDLRSDILHCVKSIRLREVENIVPSFSENY